MNNIHSLQHEWADYSEVPVKRETIVEILEKARRSPSGVNVQPWSIKMLSPRILGRLIDDVSDNAKVILDGKAARVFAKAGNVNPLDLVSSDESFVISNEASVCMRSQLARLKAPMAGLCTIDRRLAHGSQLEYGMFLQSVRFLAEQRGLAAQFLWEWKVATSFVAKFGILDEHDDILCGITFGHPLAPRDGHSIDSQVPKTVWLD